FWPAFWHEPSEDFGRWISREKPIGSHHIFEFRCLICRGWLPRTGDKHANMAVCIIYRWTPPPDQLRRPRKPVGRAQHGDCDNKDREPQGEALSAAWFGGW